jgi:hypothetical protein
MSSSNEQLDFAKFTREEVAQVFGPGSDSRKAYELSKYNPAKYAALKQAAVYSFGIVAESMLPRAHQLTREQLDKKARADAAAQKDELIEVPHQVCDRLGLPYGTKVTWEQLQKSMGRQPV